MPLPPTSEQRIKMLITNDDLLKNRHKYRIEELEENIDHLNTKILLRTQTLTAIFCIKYILVESIEGGSEDSYIFDMDYILNYQSHITENEFKETLAEWKNEQNNSENNREH